MMSFVLIVAVVAGSTHAATLFSYCSCKDTTTYTSTSSSYCPTSSYQSCDSSRIVESSCSITCDDKRSTIAYRNASLTWRTTSLITCDSGVFYNENGDKITNLQRPTCAYSASCEECPYELEEEACPEGMTCNPDNLILSSDEYECSRLSCANSAILTLYDAAKNVIEFTGTEMYCTTSLKWYNYSIDGSTTTSGGAEVNDTLTVNCALPEECEECIEPNFALSLDDLQEQFQTGYNFDFPATRNEAGQCTTVVCPIGYTLYGFTSSASEQTGLEYISRNKITCTSKGEWSDDGIGYVPASLTLACLQKQSDCPIADVVAGSGFVHNCTSEVNSITCEGDAELSMRYTSQISTVKYEQANFFPGKGWLAHSPDGTAALFTTSIGDSITASCS